MEDSGTRRYVISGERHLPFEVAAERARTLLQEAGYGVLSEIDVTRPSSTRRERIGSLLR
jgi:hypothetical protein